MATSIDDVLTPALMEDLATLADDSAVRGIAVLGSAVRGEASRFIHRRAFGLDGGDAFTQADGSVRLFRETIRLIDDRLDGPTRRDVGPAPEIAP